MPNLTLSHPFHPLLTSFLQRVSILIVLTLPNLALIRDSQSILRIVQQECWLLWLLDWKHFAQGISYVYWNNWFSEVIFGDEIPKLLVLLNFYPLSFGDFGFVITKCGDFSRPYFWISSSESTSRSESQTGRGLLRVYRGRHDIMFVGCAWTLALKLPLIFDRSGQDTSM